VQAKLFPSFRERESEEQKTRRMLGYA
jgi:hypothetical protein